MGHLTHVHVHVLLPGIATSISCCKGGYLISYILTWQVLHAGMVDLSDLLPTQFPSVFQGFKKLLCIHYTVHMYMY